MAKAHLHWRSLHYCHQQYKPWQEQMALILFNTTSRGQCYLPFCLPFAFYHGNLLTFHGIGVILLYKTILLQKLSQNGSNYFDYFCCNFLQQKRTKLRQCKRSFRFQSRVESFGKIQNIFLQFFPLFCHQKILIKILINLPL
jgi:hypothetical protein